MFFLLIFRQSTIKISDNICTCEIKQSVNFINKSITLQFCFKNEIHLGHSCGITWWSVHVHTKETIGSWFLFFCIIKCFTKKLILFWPSLNSDCFLLHNLMSKLRVFVILVLLLSWTNNKILAHIYKSKQK